MLAEERYEEAYEFLSHHEQGYYGWTPELIATVIRNYGSVEPMRDGSTYKVTPLETASGGPRPTHEVDRWGPDRGLVGEVWFDLPLNGKWSDLTATLGIRRDDDVLSLELHDIHVM